MKCLMNKFRILVFFLLIILLISSCDWYLKSQVGSFRVTFYSLIKAKDYNKASSLFYYPEYLSKKNIYDEQKRISEALKIVANELGHIYP